MAALAAIFRFVSITVGSTQPKLSLSGNFQKQHAKAYANIPDTLNPICNINPVSLHRSSTLINTPKVRNVSFDISDSAVIANINQSYQGLINKSSIADLASYLVDDQTYGGISC